MPISEDSYTQSNVTTNQPFLMTDSSPALPVLLAVSFQTLILGQHVCRIFRAWRVVRRPYPALLDPDSATNLDKGRRKSRSEKTAVGIHTCPLARLPSYPPASLWLQKQVTYPWRHRLPRNQSVEMCSSPGKKSAGSYHTSAHERLKLMIKGPGTSYAIGQMPATRDLFVRC